MKKTMFFRCCGCNAPVAPWTVTKRGCCTKCGGGKVRPSNLSLFETLCEVIKRPDVWNWHKEGIHVGD